MTDAFWGVVVGVWVCTLTNWFIEAAETPRQKRIRPVLGSLFIGIALLAAEFFGRLA